MFVLMKLLNMSVRLFYRINQLILSTQIKACHCILKRYPIKIPYTAVMTGDLDVYGNTDPFRKLRQSELCWSLMTTEIGYKVDTAQGPYSSFNSCGLYQRFEGLNCCVG